jgi:hypothetical protein
MHLPVVFFYAVVPLSYFPVLVRRGIPEDEGFAKLTHQVLFVVREWRPADCAREGSIVVRIDVGQAARKRVVKKVRAIVEIDSKRVP